MPIINGEKFACDSCVKGHRVSNCNHHDRQLNHIAPKGRPIKQCEHCRVARKSKSHHAKCDCGSKREKTKVEPKIPEEENSSCCCNNGSTCICSNKTEGPDSRLDKILQRPAHPVKSKQPRLASSCSETALTVFTNGHHKPVHRNNNLAHTSGAPYKIPRPHTLHGVAGFSQSSLNELKDSFPRVAADDMFLLQNSAKFYSSSASGTNSVESLNLASTDFNSDFLSYDLPKDFSTQPESSNEASDGIGENASEFIWLDTSLSTVAEDPFILSTTSPTFPSDVEWAIPSAASDFFSPSDLPLLASQPSSYAQPISHSGESSHQSVPGLTTTTGSSGAQSEIGDQFAIEGLWHDTVQVRDNSNPDVKWNSQASGSYESTYWPGNSLPSEVSPSNRKDLRRAIIASPTTTSESITSDVNRSSGPPSSTGTAMLMATEFSGRTSAEVEDVTEQAIMIPASEDPSDDWRWPIDNDPQIASGDVAREYGWLLDSCS